VRLSRNNREIVAVAGLAAFFIATTLFFNVGFYRLRVVQQESLLYFPNAKALHAYALGYENAMSDLLWMRTLAYFGGHYMGDRDYRHLAYMLDVITQLNPRHQSAYYMAATVLPWISGAGQESDRLIIRAMVNMPDKGQWAYYLGLNQYLFNDDKSTASHYLARAISQHFMNRMSIALAAKLRSAAGGLSAAREMLKRSIAVTTDARLSAYLGEQLKKVETEVILRRLDDQLRQKNMDKQVITSVKQIRQMGLRWPDVLPDGGHVVMDEQRNLHSSASPQRFRLHVSGRVRSLHQRGAP